MIVRHRSPFAVSRVGIGAFPRTVERTFEPTFEQLTASLFDTRRRTPVIDTAWHDGALRLTVDLPGVPADAVSVEVSGRTLTLAVATDELTWQRSVRLGATLDPEQVVARHVDGRLTVTVGTVATPEPRRIAIDTAPATPDVPAASATAAIEASEASDTSQQTPGDDAQSTPTSSTD